MKFAGESLSQILISLKNFRQSLKVMLTKVNEMSKNIYIVFNVLSWLFLRHLLKRALFYEVVWEVEMLNQG